MEGENRRAEGERNDFQTRKNNWERGERWEKRAVPSLVCLILERGICFTKHGENTEGRQGLFLLRSQWPREHNGSQVIEWAELQPGSKRGLPTSRAVRGRRGLTTARMTPIWKWLSHVRDSYGKRPSLLASSKLAYPHTVTPGPPLSPPTW